MPQKVAETPAEREKRIDNLVRIQSTGSKIWKDFKDAKAVIDKDYNSLWRPLKSGESKAGLLNTIRRTLWIAYQHEIKRDSIMRKHSGVADNNTVKKKN